MNSFDNIFEEENELLMDILENCDYKRLGYGSKKEFDYAVLDARVSGIAVMDEDEFEDALKTTLNEMDEEYRNLPDNRDLREIKWSIQNKSDESFVEDLCESWYPLSKELEGGEVLGTGIAVNFDTEEIETIENLEKKLCSILVSVEFDSYKVLEKGYSTEYGFYEKTDSHKVSREIKCEIDLVGLLNEEYKRENEACIEMESVRDL